MAEGTSRVRALFGPIAETFRAAYNSEPCHKLAQREVAQNRTELKAGRVSLPQALDYLRTLKAMTQIYGDNSCSSIVGAEYGMLLGRTLTQR